MEYGLLLLVACGVGGGVLGALLRTWAILSQLHALEDRLSIVEGIQTREVKTRAAVERWKKPSADELAVVNALQQAPPQKSAVPFWMNPGNLPRAYKP